MSNHISKTTQNFSQTSALREKHLYTYYIITEELSLYDMAMSTPTHVDEMGITFAPEGDPRVLATLFGEKLGCSFTRQLNYSGLDYSWVSLFKDTPIVIDAHECINQTGTRI